MSGFVILLHTDEQKESNDEIRKRIKAEYPGSEHFEFSEFTYLVTGPRLTSDVREALGINEENSLSAAILRLNGSYSGRSWVRLWEWMRAAEATK